MPTPAAAPPSVMVFSCGTTARHHCEGQRRVDQRFERDQPFGIDPAARGVDGQHVVERTQVEAPLDASRAVTKQIGRLFGQTERRACRLPAKPRQQRVAPLRMIRCRMLHSWPGAPLKRRRGVLGSSGSCRA